MLISFHSRHQLAGAELPRLSSRYTQSCSRGPTPLRGLTLQPENVPCAHGGPSAPFSVLSVRACHLFSLLHRDPPSPSGLYALSPPTGPARVLCAVAGRHLCCPAPGPCLSARPSPASARGQLQCHLPAGPGVLAGMASLGASPGSSKWCFLLGVFL